MLSLSVTLSLFLTLSVSFFYSTHRNPKSLTASLALKSFSGAVATAFIDALSDTTVVTIPARLIRNTGPHAFRALLKKAGGEAL